MKIGSRELGSGHCFIAAEVGQAHEGSVWRAHDYISAVATAGANGVKFQCHLGDNNDVWRTAPPVWIKESRPEYWERTGFSHQEWRMLAEHAEVLGLEMLVSPFSAEAVALVNDFVPAWKIPSPRVWDAGVTLPALATGKPVVYSNGMATEEQCLALRTACVSRGIECLEAECLSIYPHPPENVNLLAVKRLGGLSDHSGTIYPGLAAAAVGCQYLEVHVKLSEWESGPDTEVSLIPEDLARLVEGVRQIERGLH